MSAQHHDQSVATDAQLTTVYDTTPAEAWRIFDDNARYYLNMSGAEFRRKWNAGEFGDIDSHPDHVKLIDVAILLPTVEGYEPDE